MNVITKIIRTPTCKYVTARVPNDGQTQIAVDLQSEAPTDIKIRALRADDTSWICRVDGRLRVDEATVAVTGSIDCDEDGEIDCEGLEHTGEECAAQELVEAIEEAVHDLIARGEYRTREAHESIGASQDAEPNDELSRQLRHIADQAAKRHYLNALSTTHQVLGLLLRLHNDVLKGR